MSVTPEISDAEGYRGFRSLVVKGKFYRKIGGLANGLWFAGSGLFMMFQADCPKRAGMVLLALLKHAITVWHGRDAILGRNIVHERMTFIKVDKINEEWS
jgi:hypothetical protein